MNINNKCKLFLQNIYLYDITACHYSILEKLGVDISHLDKNDKTNRNIQIGLMMRNNPKLIPVLRGITESTISEYILRNNISDDDIIIRQYDGFLTSKKLKETTDLYLPLDLRKTFQVFIISSERDKYIGLAENNSISIKGLSHRYSEMDKIYQEILNINFANKTAIFQKMSELKAEVLTSNDPLLYCIPSSDSTFNVFIKRYGQIEITESMSRIMDTDDIDKEKYYEIYLKPFFESLVLEFM